MKHWFDKQDVYYKHCTSKHSADTAIPGASDTEIAREKYRKCSKKCSTNATAAGDIKFCLYLSESYI